MAVRMYIITLINKIDLHKKVIFKVFQAEDTPSILFSVPYFTIHIPLQFDMIHTPFILQDKDFT